MGLISSRGTARLGRSVSLVVLPSVLLAIACGDRVRLPSSDAERAEAMRRGDSLAAQIEVGRALADSFERIQRGELDPSTMMSLGGVTAEPLIDSSGSPIPQPSAGGRELTERAMARADSLRQPSEASRRADSMARAVTEARLRGSLGAVGARGANADTLRGVVTVEGVPPVLRVFLVMADGSRLAMTGLAMRDLLNIDGLEVDVRGIPNGPRELVVSGFIARAYNGAPVWDGTLMRTEDGWALRLTEGGTRGLGNITPTLQRFGGSRVWIGRTSTTSFGVITKR